MAISENRDPCPPAVRKNTHFFWNPACTVQTVLNTKALPLALVLAMASASCVKDNPPSAAPRPRLTRLIDVNAVPDFVSRDPRSLALWDLAKQVYTLRQFQPAWSADEAVNTSTDAALRVLEGASTEGLHPEDFGASELRHVYDLLKLSPESQRDVFDKRLTYGLVRYVSDLCFGRVDPRAINPEWPAADNNCDIPQIVNDAVDNKTVDRLAGQLSPRIPEFVGLKSRLQQYREAAEQSGWQPLPADGRITPQRDSVLARNLALTGDLVTEAVDDVPSRKALNTAVRHFQERHGLHADGKLGKRTVDAMNVPVSQRIEQIEMNMDRMRWVAQRLEARHIRVNLPAFQLSVHDGDRIPLRMRAIIGSKENPTPILYGTLEYLVFSPYWNIPLSIATKELLPKIQKSSTYLKQQNIEVVRIVKDKTEVVDPSKIKWDKETDLSGYHLRQRPGSNNALGLVKFIFPNSYNVYLHDTPSDNLFDRLTRTLSHGCIRVERPADLAAYLLEDQREWTAQHIEEAMHAEKERRVSLKTPLPIHLLYWTAWTDSDGTLQFRDDVYGFDSKHRELATATSASPAADAPDIDVHEIGAGVITDASGVHGQRSPTKK